MAGLVLHRRRAGDTFVLGAGRFIDRLGRQRCWSNGLRSSRRPPSHLTRAPALLILPDVPLAAESTALPRAILLMHGLVMLWMTMG